MSVLNSCTQRCILSLLLVIFYIVHGSPISTTPRNSDPSLNCTLGSNDDLYINFVVPKLDFNAVNVYYKMKTSNFWIMAKKFNTSGITEIADWINISLQPTTLYEARVSYRSSVFGECEFCSQTDALEPVRNLSVHSVGPNWFALTWTMADRICPKEVKYEISYHDTLQSGNGSDVWNEWKEIPNYPLTLNTGEQYVMVKDNVYPNKTYDVLVVLRVESGLKFRSKMSTLTVQTLPDPGPPEVIRSPDVMRSPNVTGSPEVTEPPVVHNATNTTLSVSVRSNCKTNCSVTWQYKEPDESAWRLAGKASADTVMEITGLNATTVYQVRALLQRSKDCEPYDGVDVPFAENTTLPVKEPKIIDHPPAVVNATNTTLTMETECEEECKGYIAHWEYKEVGENQWNYAGQQSAHRKIIINGLRPVTHYEVRYNLQWPMGRRIMNKSGPALEVKTCTSSVWPVYYMWGGKRSTKSIAIHWTYEDKCIAPYVLVRWKSYESSDSFPTQFPPDSYTANNCPINATLLEIQNLSNEGCDDYGSDYCYTVNSNIVPGTRYHFEIVTMNWQGKCSHPETARTSSLLSYWGGISVGLWSLIIIGVILLIASVPACIAVKRRLSARVAAGRDVAFSSAHRNNADNHEDGNGDEDRIVFPELSSGILERHTQPPIS